MYCTYSILILSTTLVSKTHKKVSRRKVGKELIKSSNEARRDRSQSIWEEHDRWWTRNENSVKNRKRIKFITWTSPLAAAKSIITIFTGRRDPPHDLSTARCVPWWFHVVRSCDYVSVNNKSAPRGSSLAASFHDSWKGALSSARFENPEDYVGHNFHLGPTPWYPLRVFERLLDSAKMSIFGIPFLLRHSLLLPFTSVLMSRTPRGLRFSVSFLINYRFF